MLLKIVYLRELVLIIHDSKIITFLTDHKKLNLIFTFKKDMTLKYLMEKKYKNNELLKKAFLIKEINSPELIKVSDNYFLVNIDKEINKSITFNR